MHEYQAMKKYLFS